MKVPFQFSALLFLLLSSSLTLSKPSPVTDVEESLQDSNGLPIRFLPVDPKDKVIRLSSDMNIAFHTATTCVQSMAWFGDISQITGRRYATIGVLIGHPGINTLVCGNVGVFYEDGNQWLGLNDEPLIVKFRKG
ncbi:Alpha-amylase/subtilisin inhibitor [Vitis vinifera]|uniref:Alpha-amylase/subtilisin inhibitor n=1 Tax=Vitis vinifera TaxID=29760 RepID=A0A438FXV4_VITVI|nr:Alpha-amylase/subtilisin inhibitor [Vitis vinifera]